MLKAGFYIVKLQEQKNQEDMINKIKAKDLGLKVYAKIS
jgi:hypothetical protein